MASGLKRGLWRIGYHPMALYGASAEHTLWLCNSTIPQYTALKKKTAHRKCHKTLTGQNAANVVVSRHCETLAAEITQRKTVAWTSPDLLIRDLIVTVRKPEQ